MNAVNPETLFALTGIVFISGCAGIETPAQPDSVPQIHPGILQGRLSKEELPDSFALYAAIPHIRRCRSGNHGGQEPKHSQAPV